MSQGLDDLLYTSARAASARAQWHAKFAGPAFGQVSGDLTGFEVKERWEGCVVDVFHGYFSAELINTLTTEKLEVDVDIDDVSPMDRPLVVEGALFFWTLGYETSRSSRKKSSAIRFRRGKRTRVGGLSDDALSNLREATSGRT